MPEIRYADGSVRPGKQSKPTELPSLGLDGRDLTFVRIDHEVRLQFGDAEIVIGTPFELAADGEVLTLDPERRGALGPLLALYPDTLTSAIIDPDLTLRLTFATGAAISVAQHPDYESWQVGGPGSRLVVCPPAGDGTLAVWS